MGSSEEYTTTVSHYPPIKSPGYYVHDMDLEDSKNSSGTAKFFFI